MTLFKARPVVPTGAGSVSAQKDSQAASLARYKTVAQRAKAFYEGNPAHANIVEARELEVLALLWTVRLGDVASEGRALRMAQDFRDERTLPEAARFEVAAAYHATRNQLRRPKSLKDVLDGTEFAAHQLLADFPNHPEPYRMLLGVAKNSEGARATAVAEDVLRRPAPEEVKREAQAILDREKLIGTVVEWEWVDSGEKNFRLADSRGRPVVLLAWGSWDDQTVSRLASIESEVLAAGAEFVPVNFDTDLGKAEVAAQKAKIKAKPQTDGRGLTGGAIAAQLKVPYLPCAYVVDRNGKLLGIGRPDKIATLLAATKG